jgi:hypothetical protein
VTLPLPRPRTATAARLRHLCSLGGAVLLLLTLAACNREERAHEIHLAKGRYAGKPMTRLDDGQVKALERRAANENF